ncbi:Stromelysin-3 [Vitis vinifera]|uniref:Stromelysin-3 n=1 Tax=Vitis vinifera TaxID=29760 RepID=A0A438DMB6_VITVI|nr:Stromelysin-3 [Vitis vinifera]
MWVPGPPPNSNSTTNPNYAFRIGIKWPRDHMHIHYIVFPWIQPEQPITNCFDAWAVVSNFTFEKVRDESHAKLRVTFTQRDGPRGTVASAKISLTDPTIHFDEEESWLIGAVGGSVNLKNVVTQEIGHILGLAHSQVEKVVMYATFSYGVTKKLAQDDIDGIRAKYST